MSSSPKPSKAERTGKSPSPGSDDLGKKKCLPIATSTPVAKKTNISKAVSKPSNSAAARSKTQAPSRPVLAVRTSSEKSKRSEETSLPVQKKETKPRQVVSSQKNEAKPRPPALKKKREIVPAQQERFSKRIEETPEIKDVQSVPPSTKKPGQQQARSSSTSQGKQSSNVQQTNLNPKDKKNTIPTTDAGNELKLEDDAITPTNEVKEVIVTPTELCLIKEQPVSSGDGDEVCELQKKPAVDNPEASLCHRKASMTLPLVPMVRNPEEGDGNDNGNGSFSDNIIITPTSSGRIHLSAANQSVPSHKRLSVEVKSFCPQNLPLSPSIPLVRRRLSFLPTMVHANQTPTHRRASDVTSMRGSSSSINFEVLKRGNNSVDSLKVLNRDLRDQVTKLRSQVDNQRGSMRNAQWQKVVDIRHTREEEQQRLNAALTEQFQKLEKEKQRELDQLRDHLTKKHESELQKSSRFKDADISKLKQEVASKEGMLRRLLGESRRHQMKLDIDDRKLRLVDELKDLRQAKKDLESSLENASFAERAFSNNLRRHSESFESEMSKVKKEAQAEIRQLIEQLKNKDKLISQLEKDLGRQAWGAAAHFAVLERRRSEGSPLPPGGLDLSPPFRTLPEGSDDPNPFRWTPTSIQTPGDVEDVGTNDMEGTSLGKHDLPSALKDNTDHNKELVEKCRSFLQQNKELTAHNRAFQESIERSAQDTKKAQELVEHSKLQMLHLSRQLNQLKAEKQQWEQQMRDVEGRRQERMEDKKMINALRKACSDKDRRIDLMQHRKKRRRVLETVEKAKIQSAGLRETSFGYEEDDRVPLPLPLIDGNQSVCSLSSTISEDSAWDEVLSKEEMERNYQTLMMEQLELQKAHAMLQTQTDNLQDPQRENLSKTDLQNDLFASQYRIEQLEYFIKEGLQGQCDGLIEEREIIQKQNIQLKTKVKNLENANKRLHKELADVEERNEEMEFRLIELEQFGDSSSTGKELPCQQAINTASSPCSPSTFTSNAAGQNLDSASPLLLLPDTSSSTADTGIEHTQVAARMSREMDNFAKELTSLLKGKGRDADSALKKLDAFLDKEKALEGMAHELQMKAISLQKEKNALQDRLLWMEQSQPGKGGNSAALSEAKERQENIALKVDFLQKAEAASVQRIEELESIVEDLRQQLDEKSEGKSQSQKDAHKLTEMKHQMTFLETDNKALSARIAELEENEEILRENWRRVADEDFNRTQCLEEKVKMVEAVNRELKLKLKLSDAQEYLAIDVSRSSMSKSNLSLAAELQEFDSKIFDDTSDEDDMGDEDELDSPSKHSDSSESDKKVMKEKMRKLERQLSEVSEKKNTKIESLQEQLGGLKETEIKLSETIMEMEMTERELRAKLALYESSEVTVEKMLKYQSKIEELRTSQESLLDQLEIKENQEMTLQEKIQEMERTLRGKIVSLEVEMKGYKQRELKNAGQIREFEKQESELTEKVAQQAEKENGLYIKISSLKDEVKTAKTDLESVRHQMEEKEDKVRQAKLLEVKLLEIEMECGKKVSTLDARLRHREEEFRLKEKAHEEQISTLKERLDSGSKFEEEFARKEQEIEKMTMEKETNISNLLSEISELQRGSTEVSSKVNSLEKDLESERQKVCEKENLIQILKEDLESKVKHLESVMIEKEDEFVKEKQSLESEIDMKKKRVSQLESEMKETVEHIAKLKCELERSGSEAAQREILKVESFYENCISEVENKVASKLSLLESKLKTVQSHCLELERLVSEKCVRVQELETENEEMRKIFEKDVFDLETEKDELEDEFKSKMDELNSQLEEERNKRESEESVLVKDSQEREASLKFDVSNLQHQVEQHKHELIAKLSELESKNKAHCELSLELSNIRHDHKSVQKELSKSKQTHFDIKSTLESKEEELDRTQNEITRLNEIVEKLNLEVVDKDQAINKVSAEKDNLLKEKSEEGERLREEKSVAEKQFIEKCDEISKVNELHLQSRNELDEVRKSLNDKDHVIQKHEEEKGEKEMMLKETQSHVQSAQVQKENLTQQLQSMGSLLEEAQNQITQQHQELQALQNQLQSHREEIELSKVTIKDKDDQLQEKDQMYHETVADQKKLQREIEDRDQKLENAQCRVADVEQKLQKAENRVRELESMHVSLEMRLEERYAVSEDADKVLLSKEIHCKELENKLSVTDKNLSNLKDQVSVGEESSKRLVQKLEEKEMEFEEQKKELSVLQVSLDERNEVYLSLESKYKELEVNYQFSESKNNEAATRLDKLADEKQALITSLESKLQLSESNVDKLSSELTATKEKMVEIEKCYNDSESQVIVLQDESFNLKSKCNSLESKLDLVSKQFDQKNVDYDDLLKQTNDKDSELHMSKAETSKNAQELTNQILKCEENEKMNSKKIVELENLNKELQPLKDIVEKLTSEKVENNYVTSQLESDKSDLASSIDVLGKENEDLKTRINNLDHDFDAINKKCTDLTEENQTLSSTLSDAKSDHVAKIKHLESYATKSGQERDDALLQVNSKQSEIDRLEMDNVQLQKEIEEASKEFQSLAQSFEESKTNIENRVQEISEGKQKVEEDFVALQKEHSVKTSEMVKEFEGKEEEISNLKEKCDRLVYENSSLVANVDSLKLELSQKKDNSKLLLGAEMVQEDQMVCETTMQVSMAPPSLSSTPSKSDKDKEQQRFSHLEATLNDMTTKEKQLQKRVGELETVEKELREQIVDIEMTVIVPLENENQEMKDELGIVRQERDEAISKISKWGDDDDDDERNEQAIRDSETVHQRLEDALLSSEELEKKNVILSDDIQKLENEKETLHGRITDLEANAIDKNDEVESLLEEINRLQEVHRDASVLEETETTLMDRVLDLEEKERLLSQELDKVKETTLQKDGTELEALNEKLNYLEQKNQILQDAEGRYMDKIMELEEDRHRLLSKLSSFSNSVNIDTSSQPPHIPHTSVNKESVSSSTQTSVSSDDSPVVGATDPSSLSNSPALSGQTHSSSNNENGQIISSLEDQVKDSQVKLGELDAKLREKDTVVLYLQDKLELLKESEGKLMDKLLEAEETASNAMHSKYSSQILDLNKKIEQSQEENEFLAESVEQYKKLFKEEKEKCNDLQDRLMEDSSAVTDLQKSQEELEKTQQMVEEIQSEYEEQLSEHDQREHDLREELSQAVKKQGDLEETLIYKTRKEEELQEQVDSLKSLEKDLRSRLAVVVKVDEEDSALSDSGLSADDPRVRNDHANTRETDVIEAPIIHRSVKTVLLSKPPGITHNNASPSLTPNDPAAHLPRLKRRLRQQSIENAPREELVFLVEDLQEREGALNKRLSDLQSVEDSSEHLAQRVVELESEKDQLQKRLLRLVDQQQNALYSDSPSYNRSITPAAGLYGDVEHKGGISGGVDLDLDRSFTSGVSSLSAAMLEKPEDVLLQKIKELEGLDKHNKNMVSELERDREVLHEIARGDKAAIHDLNVKIRELQLSERSLKEQVTNLEVSESSLFTKCEELEAVRVQLEDRVHELEIHERRLRELVRKLKLDESRWLSKSDGMENAVAELSANETQLKRLVQDIEMEKGGLSEKAEYLEARIRELESVEVALLARIKEYENNEVSLQNRLVQLENAEAAAHSRASELDMLNVNLAQKHKKMVDEHAVMAQHLAQFQGQVQELDRRLLSSRDSEIAYKQHVESLQKNESLLQKKVREFELREIDSQSLIREREQTIEINSDKLSALQRSENRLKYRVQELEGVGGQIPGELTPSQKQKIPQNMEDCQKQIVVLQGQVENLKLQLRQALQTTQPQRQPADKQSDDNEDNNDEDKTNLTESVKVEMEEYRQLHAKAALLDEYAYQNGELEASQEQLTDTILQLRQGKGACGHEVEIEVYKRRIESLQALMSKLKSSLSSGQSTSLLDPDLESGPLGDTLPARHLQVLESERVLQSVRGLHHDGKADTPTSSDGGVHSTGLTQVEESMIQAEAVRNMASMPLSTAPSGGPKQHATQEQPSHLEEESHWRAIEARRKPAVTTSSSGAYDDDDDSRGGVSNAARGREGTIPVSSSPRHRNNQSQQLQGSTTTEIEEVITSVLNLPSESEHSSYHNNRTTMTQNDTDSSSCHSPIPPPRKNRANRLSKNLSDDNNSSNSGSGVSDNSNIKKDHHRHSANTAHYNIASANQKHFVNEESLPLTASNIEKQLFSSQQQQQQQVRPPLSRFAEDSFYLPSSTQEGVDSLDDDDESPPPLPTNGPPGQEAATMISGRSSRASSTNMQDNRRESLDNSTSGLSIRDRIAMIERHLQSDTHTGSNREEEDQLFYWKRKSTENLRQAETLDKNNKFLKEDLPPAFRRKEKINRLEKELEEKRRYINTLELWLSGTEDLLKNKTKQTDREMVEKLHVDLQKLRQELNQSGYRSEDAILDPAALKTELEHKDKEIVTKRNEIETLAQELRRCHKECRSIEGMRRNALDSLRALEKQVLHLQNTEDKLKKSQAEISSLKIQYDEMDQFKNQALAMVQPLQIKVDRLADKCREKDVLLRRLGVELRRGLHRPSSALDELTRLERAMNGEEYNTDNSDSLSDDMSPRVTAANHKLRGRSVSLDELSINSEPDSLHMLSGNNNNNPTTTTTGHTPPKRQRPTPYVNTRPKSAEAGGSHGLRGSPHGLQASQASPRPHSTTLPGQRGQHLHQLRRGFDLSHERFVAIADYDPGLYSQSGRPRMELALREGDDVRVTGPMDRLGYCEAQCNGRTGLVPANYLQPVHYADMNGLASSPTATSGLEHSGIEPPMGFQDHRLQHSAFNGGNNGRLSNKYSAIPDPPSSLHVRGVREGCLVLAWKPPPLDTYGCSKGLQLIGYRVYVNNQEYKQIPSPQICQVTVDDRIVDPSTPHHLGVQSVYAGGRSSSRAELVFEGMVRLGEDGQREEDQDEALDTDLSSVLNSVHYTKGIKKKVMALYEYNPEHQSPHDYTAFELPFHAGDVIAVYGQPRPDGFYHGEIEGRRGLVPACFVEDLSKALRHGMGSEGSGHKFQKSSKA